MVVERPLRLATRGSPLALAQARLASAALRPHHRAGIEIIPVATRGDRSQAAGDRLDELARATPGLFSSEIEAALLASEADIAVHSYKDLPSATHPNAVVAGVLPRANPADVLVVGITQAASMAGDRAAAGLAALGAMPPATRVGTSSPRRSALLAHYAPHVVAEQVRGNVGTRIAHCRDGKPPAIVLAAAGLDRLHHGEAPADLGRDDHPPTPLLDGMRAIPLPPQSWHPAPAQGALALQVAAGSPVRGVVAAIDHAPTRQAVALERACLAALGGGCAQAVGAWAEWLGDGRWRLHLGYAQGGRWHARVATDTVERLQALVAEWGTGGPAPGSVPPGRGWHDPTGGGD